MSGKHRKKFSYKYLNSAWIGLVALSLVGCRTKRVPEGDYLLTKNKFEYVDRKDHSDRLPSFVRQRPKFDHLQVFLYNQVNPKYIPVLEEYYTYPENMRNQKLRDSLFVKHRMPEEVGSSLLFNRFIYQSGRPPLILDVNKTQASANNIRKYLVYRGFWDAEVEYDHKLDSLSRRAQALYRVTYKDPTIIQSYSTNISDPSVRAIYSHSMKDSPIKVGEHLDQEQLEKELKRVNQMMTDAGYYNFNASGEEVFFTADTLQSRKEVPLSIDIKKDKKDSPYKLATIGKVEVKLVKKFGDTTDLNIHHKYDGNISIEKFTEDFKDRPILRRILLKEGQVYNQQRLDHTRRNLVAMNSFNVSGFDRLKTGSDSILHVRYVLVPLDRFQLKVSMDAHYSEILNFGLSPGIELTTRNLFGGAENLTANVSGILGTTNTGQQEKKYFNAYEIGAGLTLSFPRLLMPGNLERFVSRDLYPSSNINMGFSIQNNIGLGRINFNGGLNYQFMTNAYTSHRLTLLNTQLNMTRNRENYYDLFPTDFAIRERVFNDYFATRPDVARLYSTGQYNADAVSGMIVNDELYQGSRNTEMSRDLVLFRQTLLNRDRQTQDVLINGLNYQLTYDEVTKNDRPNPFYFMGKVELAGNLLSLLTRSRQGTQQGVLGDADTKTVFGIPFSQFVKVDLDFRKYFQFGKASLVLRQFIGAGISYGNSRTMPFIRSYFNGGANDIRAWRAFGGLGPSDSQLPVEIRAFTMEPFKLTSNIEFRYPINTMFETAVFADAGNIWSLRSENTQGEDTQFRFKNFLGQMGIGAGAGLRVKVAYIVLRVDLAYPLHDPNMPKGERWRFSKIQPLLPTVNFAIGYPF